MTKCEALAAHIGCDADEFLSVSWCENTVRHGANEYLVLTDEEADEKVAESITESLWAFRAAFVLNFLGVNSGKADAAFEKMQGELCEDANDLIKALLGDRLPEFIKRAVSADGRGHFLAGYDHEEVEAGEFYIYRTN